MTNPEVEIKEWVRKPTDEYPMGSYLRTIGGKVDVATGFYEKMYPGHPSLYFHGGPPFVLFECGSGEMGTFYWSKDGKEAEMFPATEEQINRLVIERDAQGRIVSVRNKGASNSGTEAII